MPCCGSTAPRGSEWRLGRDRLGFPRSIAEIGISKEDFERAMPEMVQTAYEDPSWRSNPRMPLMSELAELFWKAYAGRGTGKKQSAPERQTA